MENMNDLNDLINAWGSIFTVLFFILIIWSMVWKGIALWKAGGNRDKVWFIILFLVNTVGILEILYIFIFSKKSTNKETDGGTK